MTFNEGGWDRVIRVLAGIALAYATWVIWPGTTSVVFAVIGATALLTGLVGWCPGYALFGLSTKKKKKIAA
jgi:hypothetical protein